MLVESSQAHAADEYIYVDLGTSAGSRVDGQPADEQTLHTGDRIELGHWTLSFSGRSSPTMAGPTADGRAAKGPPSGRKRSRALVGPPPTAAVTGKAPTPASTSSAAALAADNDTPGVVKMVVTRPALFATRGRADGGRVVSAWRRP